MYMEDMIYDFIDGFRQKGFQEVFTEDIECKMDLVRFFQDHPLPSGIAIRCVFKWDNQENIGLLKFQFNEFYWLQGHWNLPDDFTKRQIYFDRKKVDVLDFALTEVKTIREHWKEWYHIYTEEERKELEAAANEETIPF